MQKVWGHLHSDSTPSWPTDHVARKGRVNHSRWFSGANDTAVPSRSFSVAIVVRPVTVICATVKPVSALSFRYATWTTNDEASAS